MDFEETSITSYYQGGDAVVIYHVTTTPINDKLSLQRCRDGNDKRRNSEAIP